MLRIAPISIPPFYQWRDRGCNKHAPRLGDALGILKRTLHQEPHLKSEDLFFGKILISGKMPNF